MLPEQTFVLVGYYRNKEHLRWILESGLYNARAGTKRGSLRLRRGEAEAKFLLLHSEGELKSNKLFQITDKGPRIFSKKDLIKKGYYKEPGQDYYLVYKVGNLEFEELQDMKIDIRKLKGYKTGRASALPFSATLSETMKAKVPEND